MTKLFKKLSAFFDDKPDIRKVYDDAYNAELLKQAHEGIVPGMILKAGYFAIEWILYIVSMICFIYAFLFWNGPFEKMILNLRFIVPPDLNNPESSEIGALANYLALFFFLLPGFIFYILARQNRAKHIQLQKLAKIAKKIDEVEKNLTYRIENAGEIQ